MAKRILLADDSITIQKVVELTFSDGDYEVTAVNNGAKAIQKLSEMRPDIILSDIIMPEKNGYEVCEFVKSHPEFRTIPVVLLTGTFEPFDPDRADKAGCDAVVTKPFESQSLIHKVEELIDSAKSQAPSAPAASAPAAAESPFAPQADAFATSAFQPQGSDIFGAPPASTSPFDDMSAGAPVGETKAFPRMTFDDLQKMTSEPAAAPPPPAPAAEASPWDEAPATSGETKAFPKMSFDDLSAMATPSASAPEPPPAAHSEGSPWEETPAVGGETKAFPRMSFEELHQMATAPPPAPAPEPLPTTPEPSPWDSGPTESAAPGDTVRPAEAASPWDETPAAGGETKAFPRMSFDDLQQMASTPSSPAAEEAPFTAPPAQPEPEPIKAAPSEAAAPAYAPGGGDLTEDQIDRIARRVVQLMSEELVRNIAWEVIPDMAEMVVKERIRQLESEA